MAEETTAEARRVGRLIAELRKSRGLSQLELAHKIDVGPGTVSRWERGLHTGYVKNVRKLAQALEVPPAVLYPAAPDLESQLDRIEDKLERLLAVQGITLEQEADVDRLTAEIGSELAAEACDDQPGAARTPGAGGARATQRTRGAGRRGQ